MTRLLQVMARLRDPDGGCPWDLEQNFATIAPYTIEEAYEVADAIAREAWDELAGELGDLLLQVVYHARLAEEQGLFDFAHVADAIGRKMVERHPHVFGAGTVADAGAQSVAWDAIKALERARRATAAGRSPSVLDDLPLALPALTRALKLQRRAGRIGFDWQSAAAVMAKIKEEIAEIEEALAEPDGAEAVREEIGDLLFTVANLARHLDVDPEEALRATNRKFERRFRRVEDLAAPLDRDTAPDLATLERFWEQAKREERRGTADGAQSRSRGR